jgi:hypothetical protein
MARSSIGWSMSATRNTDSKKARITRIHAGCALVSPTSHGPRYVCDPTPMPDRSRNTGSNLIALLCMAISLTLFSVAAAEKATSLSDNDPERIVVEPARKSRDGHVSVDSRLGDVLHHPAFSEFSRLLLPWDDRTYDESMPLSRIASLLPYHSHVSPNVVASALNHMIDDARSGRTIFYDFYSDAQKRDEPARAHTGLFLFRGRPGAPFAIIAPGGGFSYVGSVHEGFPHAAEISKQGYNAFVLKYRRGMAGTLPRRISPLPSPTFSATRKRSASPQRGILSGVARPERGWSPTSAPTG